MKENRLTLIYILVAYVFVFLFHLYWLSFASKIPEFYWNGQLMINNVDGYYYGSGAQKILYGMHQYNPRLQDVWSIGNLLMGITAYIAKFFHLSIDSVMLYLPAVVSSLVVVPIILIGRLYGNLLWGLLAALIGGIGWSFYNRTLVGYFDTDMFSVVLPVFVLYFLLASIKKESLTDVFVAVILAIIYPWVYGSGKAVLYSVFALYALYLLIFKREFGSKATLFLIVLLPFNIFIQFILAVGIFIILKKMDTSNYQKHLLYASIIAFLVFLFGSGFLLAILKSVFSYTEESKNVENLHFFNVAKTVREAGNIPWYIVFDRIIGSTVGIIIAVIGYILLVRRYKEFIIALPLWGIGFFAFFGGLRFTVYAVPIAAISGVYFFIWLSSKAKEKRFQITIPIIGSIILIAPNITHIVGCCENNKFLSSIKKFYPLSSYPYLVPTTFKRSEVAVLDELRKKSNEKDYVITWWDYGYPIWYYANVNTLIDGGKHHEDNFIVSKILTTSNQYLAHNLGLLAIKEYIKTKKPAALSLFIKDKKPINVNEYLQKVGSSSFTPPKLDRDVYLMLPYRMFNIFPTVSIFSNRNINTGEVYPRHTYFKDRFIIKGPFLIIGGSVGVDLRSGMLITNNQKVPLKDITVVGYNRDLKLLKDKREFHKEGLHLIVLKDYKEAMIVDDYYFNSTFVQMFIFENYDKKLFEPVILNPWMKIYKYKQ